MLQWDDIRYFLALARHGSLSGAARALGVEHSTISRRVAQLETDVGTRLFDRLPRGWQLTAQGRDLVEKAEATEAAVLGFRRSATGVDPLVGPVRVSAPPILLAQVILPGLSGFLATHTGITLDLTGERRLADLTRAEADIAIRLARPTAPDLVVRPLGLITYGLYGTASWAAREADTRLYVGFDDSIADLPQKRWLEDHAGEAAIVLRSNDLGTLLAAAVAGLGIALLPDFLAGPRQDLVRLPLDRSGPAIPVFLVMHPDIRRSRRVRLMADHLIATLTTVLAGD